MKKRIGLGARNVVVWAPEGACGRVPLVVMPVFRGDGSDVWRRCRELECPAFSLVSIGGVAWERDMTPWAAEPATRREAAYEGGAPAFLTELLNEVLPAAEADLAGAGLGVAWRGIAGYSLAGLFALWSTWQTDAFLRVASASGSLWYEGWLGFARGQEPVTWPERAYLSGEQGAQDAQQTHAQRSHGYGADAGPSLLPRCRVHLRAQPRQPLPGPRPAHGPRNPVDSGLGRLVCWAPAEGSCGPWCAEARANHSHEGDFCAAHPIRYHPLEALDTAR